MIPGTRVRFTAITGVASRAMRARLGEIGVVQRAIVQNGRTKIAVRFAQYSPISDPETYWLNTDECEVCP